ncbi:MAG: lysophospholipid acyltransferase family protein, partial [Vicinamibacterales bacterium]
MFTVRVAVVLAVLLPLLRVRLFFVRDAQDAHQLVRRCARRVMVLCRIDVQVLHPERMPQDGASMLVSNHVSIADAAVLLGALPFDVRFVANHIYAQYPILGPIIRGASANIVNRGSWRSRADSGQAMQDALASGRSLLVFPEGT